MSLQEARDLTPEELEMFQRAEAEENYIGKMTALPMPQEGSKVPLEGGGYAQIDPLLANKPFEPQVQGEPRDATMDDMLVDRETFKFFKQQGAFKSEKGAGEMFMDGLEMIVDDMGQMAKTFPERFLSNFHFTEAGKKYAAKSKATNLQMLGDIELNYDMLIHGGSRVWDMLWDDDMSEEDIDSSYEFWKKVNEVEKRRQNIYLENATSWMTAGMDPEIKRMITSGEVEPDRQAAMGASMVADPSNFIPFGAAFKVGGSLTNKMFRGSQIALLNDTKQAILKQATLQKALNFGQYKGKGAFGRGASESVKKQIQFLDGQILENLDKIQTMAKPQQQALLKFAGTLPKGNPVKELIESSIKGVPIKGRKSFTGTLAGSGMVVTGKVIENAGNMIRFLKDLPAETAITTAIKMGIPEEKAVKLFQDGIARKAVNYAAAGTTAYAVTDLLTDDEMLSMMAAGTVVGLPLMARFGRDMSLVGRELMEPATELNFFQRLGANGRETITDRIIDRDGFLSTARGTLEKNFGAGQGKVLNRAVSPRGQLSQGSQMIVDVLNKTKLGRPVEGIGRLANQTTKGMAIGGAFGYVAGGGEQEEAMYGGMGGGAAFGGGAYTASKPFRMISGKSAAEIQSRRHGSLQYFTKNLLPSSMKQSFGAMGKGEQIAYANAAMSYKDTVFNFKQLGKDGKGGRQYRVDGTSYIEVNTDSAWAIEPLVRHEISHYLEETGGSRLFTDLLLGNHLLEKAGEFTLRDSEGKPVMREDGKGYKTNSKLDDFKYEYGKFFFEEGKPRQEVIDLIPDEVIAREVVAEHGADFFLSDNRRYRDLHEGPTGALMRTIVSSPMLQNKPFLRSMIARLGGTFRADGLLQSPNGVFGGMQRIPAVTELLRKYNREIEGLSKEKVQEKFPVDDGQNVIDIKGAEFAKNPELIEQLRAGTIMKVDENGNIVPDTAMTPAQQRKYNKDLSDSLLDAISRKDAADGLPAGHIREKKNEDTGAVSFEGRFIDESIIDEVAGQGGWNKAQIALLKEINLSLKNGSNQKGGSDWLLSYFKATVKGGGKYVNAKVQHVLEVPYGIEITQKGNINIRTISVDQLYKNIDKIFRQQQAEVTRLFGTANPKDSFMDAMHQYHLNHAEGKHGWLNLDGNPDMAKEKMNFINAMFGKSSKAHADANPWLAALDGGAKSKNPRPIYRSRRLERIGKADQLTGQRHVDPARIINNLMPPNKGTTGTKAFKNWFGNSKVVDEKGQPLVVHHGTDTQFNTFNDGRSLGPHFGNIDQANDIVSGKKNTNIMPVYLSIKNPLRLMDAGNDDANSFIMQLSDVLDRREVDRLYKLAPDSEAIEIKYGSGSKFDEVYRDTNRRALLEVKKSLISEGYDGVVYRNEHEGKQSKLGADSYIAFSPEQIKSATGNKGTFDSGNPDIRYMPPKADDMVQARTRSGMETMSVRDAATRADVDQINMSMQGRPQLFSKDKDGKFAFLDDALAKEGVEKLGAALKEKGMKERITKGWEAVTNTSKAFKVPTTKSKNIERITQQASGGKIKVLPYKDADNIGFHLVTKSMADNVKKSLNDPDADDYFNSPESIFAYHSPLDVDSSGRSILHVDSSQAPEQGQGFGFTSYQILLDYAAANNMVYKPSSLSQINQIRSLSAMLSSALKHKSTKHLKPNVDNGFSKAEVKAFGKNYEQDIAWLAMAEMNMARERFKEIGDFDYNFKTGKFSEFNKPITDKRLRDRLMSDDRIGWGKPMSDGVGLATAKRAIITNKLFLAQVKDQGPVTSKIFDTGNIDGIAYMPPKPPFESISVDVIKNLEGDKKAIQAKLTMADYPDNPYQDSVALPARMGVINNKVSGMFKNYDDVVSLINKITDKIEYYQKKYPEFTKRTASFYSDMGRTALDMAKYVPLKGRDKYDIADLQLRFLALGSPRSAVAANMTKSGRSIMGHHTGISGHKINPVDQQVAAQETALDWKGGKHFEVLDADRKGASDKVRNFYLNGLAELIEIAKVEGTQKDVDMLMNRAAVTLDVIKPKQTLSAKQTVKLKKLLDGLATVDMWDMAAKEYAHPAYVIKAGRPTANAKPFLWSIPKHRVEKTMDPNGKYWKAAKKDMKIDDPAEMNFQQANSLQVDGINNWNETTWKERSKAGFTEETKWSYYKVADEGGLTPQGGGPLYDAHQTVDGLIADSLNKKGVAKFFGKEKLLARNAQEILWALTKFENPLESNQKLVLFGDRFKHMKDAMEGLRAGKGLDPKKISKEAQGILGAMLDTYNKTADQKFPFEVDTWGDSSNAKAVQDQVSSMGAGDRDAGVAKITDAVADQLGAEVQKIADQFGEELVVQNVQRGFGGYTEDGAAAVTPNISMTMRGNPETVKSVMMEVSSALDQADGNVFRQPTIIELNDPKTKFNEAVSFDTKHLDKQKMSDFFMDISKLVDSDGDSFLTGFTMTDDGMFIGDQYYKSGRLHSEINSNFSALNKVMKKHGVKNIEQHKLVSETFARGEKVGRRSSFQRGIHNLIKSKVKNAQGRKYNGLPEVPSQLQRVIDQMHKLPTQDLPAGKLTKAKEGLASSLDLLHIEGKITDKVHKAEKDALTEFLKPLKAKAAPASAKIKKKLLSRLDDKKTTLTDKKNILWHMRSGYFKPSQFDNKAKALMGDKKSLDLIPSAVRKQGPTKPNQSNYFTSPSTSGKVRR